MAKFCSNCGAELRDNATFCSKCGKAQVAGAQSAAAPRTVNPTGASAQNAKLFWFAALAAQVLSIIFLFTKTLKASASVLGNSVSQTASLKTVFEEGDVEFLNILLILGTIVCIVCYLPAVLQTLTGVLKARSLTLPKVGSIIFLVFAAICYIIVFAAYSSVSREYGLSGAVSLGLSATGWLNILTAIGAIILLFVATNKMKSR